MSLLTLGTVAFDTIETPFGKADRIIGGAGTYIAWAASHFHKDLQLLSVIGEDFPAEELAALEARGVNLDGLEKREGEKSFFWAGRYHMNMNARDTLATELNVLENYSPKLPEGYKNPEYLLLGNFAPAVQMQVLEQLEKRPKLVAMDTMNFWMDIAMEELKAVLKQVDILIINDEEARQLSGEYSLVKAARVIREMGPKYLVIKKESMALCCSMANLLSLFLLCLWKKYLILLELAIALPVALWAIWLRKMTTLWRA